MTSVTRSKLFLYAAWGTALAATAGSLILSGVFHFMPCALCWYQRILMFPLPVILTVGLYRRDRDVWMYAIPLAALGALVAAYHSLLQWGIIHEVLAPCTAGIACTVRQINWLGFVTIPFMSFLSFALVLGWLVAYRYARASDLSARPAAQDH
jgi:disulfide bond formation protein DsbB